ncbi:capsular polysaccharide biosynthesis protein [Mumia flava]|uniref:Capsular polysaccharide biosynthesis protein n=1 Tax=Mumia flava TaxID=1348852 RepID=A0A0B2BV59_9ACTN|nr:glycosyltransferase 61 family protein [Mumia flava]PJJ58134.1 capsular polysaccharide biosynthesis protein [Mumia flava]
MDRYATLLPSGGRRVVAVVADGSVTREVTPYLDDFGDDDVLLLTGSDPPAVARDGVAVRVCPGLDDVHQALKETGPVDLVVVVRRMGSADHLRAWQRLFFHLRPGGAYVVDRTGVADDDRVFERSLSASAWLIGTSEDDLPAMPRVRRERLLAIGEVLQAPDYLIATKRRRHLLKVREYEAPALLPVRSRHRLEVRELAAEPGGTFTSSARIHSYEATHPIPHLETAFDHPPIRMRHYEGPIVLGHNGLAISGDSVLPESFRYHQVRAPKTAAPDVGPAWVRRPRGLASPRHLDGRFYYLDYRFAGHFGHFMTDALSRLWGWDQAKRELPDLKILFGTRPWKPTTSQLEYSVLKGFGIDRADVVRVEEPVTVDAMVGVTPLWHNSPPYHANPRTTEIWSRLGGMAAGDAPRPERIFVSRRTGLKNRDCTNADEVERFFADRGFEILYPEDHPLAVQAGIFAHARVVAGFGGSGLFNLAFAQQVETLIILNHEWYGARNEHLIACLLGVDTHYFWNEAVTAPKTPGVYDADAYQSAWRFDFARHGERLDGLVRSVP